MEPESASIPQLAETHLKKSNISTPESASVPDAETVKHTHNTTNSQSEDVSSSELLKGLFTDDFCHVCSAVLQFESQRISHYEGKKHAQKVRLYLQAKRDEGKMNNDLTVFQKDGSVDRVRFCELCNMVFSSPVVARSHYEGKVHAKNLRKLGLHPAMFALQQADNPASQGSPAAPSDPLQGSCPQKEEGEKEVEKAKEEEKVTQESPASATKEVDLSDPNKHCRMCAASFNNPQVAKQHYSGRKHQRNQARLRLLKELEEDGQAGAHLESGTFTCPVCNVTLNSVEMYEAHMQGNKHQQKEMKVADMICKSQRKVYDSFQDELADYIQVQKARGLEPKTQLVAEEGEEEEEEEEVPKDEGEACSGPAGLEQGERAPLPPFYPPAPWCPPFPSPSLHSGFGVRAEGPSWGRGHGLAAPAFPPGSVTRGFESQPHRGDSEGRHGHSRGRERTRYLDGNRDRDRSSSDASSTSSHSSSSSSGSSSSSSGSSRSSDHSRRERRKRRRRRERRRRAKEVDSEEEEERRRRRRERRRKSRRHGEGRRDEGHRVKRRRVEEGVEEEGAVEKQDRTREKEKDQVQDERKEKVRGEKGQAREGKPKHRKEKRTRERTDKEDTRTEEEKLWDESILGLL